MGNVVYLRDLLKDGWDPMVIRLFLISARYRDRLDLTSKQLEQARSQLGRLQELVRRLQRVTGRGEGRTGAAAGLLSDFEEAMDEDLNTPRALTALFEFLKKANALLDADGVGRAEADEMLAALNRVNAVLGILEFGEEALPDRVQKLIAEREEARARRDFAAADRIRAQLLEEGFVVEDSSKGTVWKRRRSG